MSWGLFADLRLTLPSSAWSALRERRPQAFALPHGWSALLDARLESELSSPNGSTSFEDFLRSALFQAPRGRVAINETTDSVTLRATTLLDKSQLAEVQPLAALLMAAADSAKKGELRLVNDGTYAGELGSVVQIKNGQVQGKRLTNDKLRATLVKELERHDAPRDETIPPSVLASPYAAEARSAWSLIDNAKGDALLAAYGKARLRAHFPTVETSAHLKKALVEHDYFDFNSVLRLCFELESNTATPWLRALLAMRTPHHADFAEIAVDYVWTADECFVGMSAPPLMLQRPYPTTVAREASKFGIRLAARKDLNTADLRSRLPSALTSWEGSPPSKEAEASFYVAWTALLHRDPDDALLSNAESRAISVDPSAEEECATLRKWAEGRSDDARRAGLMQGAWAVLAAANDEALMKAYAKACAATKDSLKAKTASQLRRKVLPAQFGVQLQSLELVLRIAHILDPTRAKPLVSAAPSLWKEWIRLRDGLKALRDEVLAR